MANFPTPSVLIRGSLPKRRTDGKVLNDSFKDRVNKKFRLEAGLV
jgi:hypothetical protein